MCFSSDRAPPPLPPLPKPPRARFVSSDRRLDLLCNFLWLKYSPQSEKKLQASSKTKKRERKKFRPCFCVVVQAAKERVVCCHGVLKRSCQICPDESWAYGPDARRLACAKLLCALARASAHRRHRRSSTFLLPSAARRRPFAPLRAVSGEICAAFNLCRITCVPALSLPCLRRRPRWFRTVHRSH